MGRIRIGCSGWNYRHWRAGVFYPERLPATRWLAFYAEHFDTVELNNTFYRLPTERAAKRWAGETPESFVFAAKVSRFLTHVKHLREVEQSLPRLLERIAPLEQSGKLGPLLWQLPPNFSRDDDRLEAALAAFPRRLRHAVEFRHPSWFVPETMERLRAHDVALVVADRPEIAGFQTHDVTTDFVYVRFHYGSRGRRGNYSAAELASWAERIEGWAARGDVYAYFNNDWAGFAPANARDLTALVSGKRARGSRR